MQKKIIKLTSLIMMFGVFFCLVACVSSVDRTTIQETPSAVETNDNNNIYEETLGNEYLTRDQIAERGHESIASELVSEVSIGYNNIDGSKTLYVYSQPINYINEHFEWETINTQITEVSETRIRNMGYKYTILSSDVKSYYPEILSKHVGIKLQKNIYQFGTVESAESQAEYVERENFIGKYRDMLLYSGAISGSDMYVYPSTLGTNVEVEIKQEMDQNQFQFWVEIGEGMDVVKHPGGYLSVEQTINGATSILGIIQKPLIKDSEGKCSYDCTIRSVRKTDSNRYIVTITFDKAFNKIGSRIFIAYEIRREKQPDNCLYSNKPNLTHAYLSNYSVIGNSNEYGIGRLMLRYTLAPFALDASKIRSATYELFALTNENAEVELVPVLEDWCSITGNWNNQYSTGEKVFKSQMKNHVWAFDITESVREWFLDKSGQLEHNGLQLKYVNENAEGSILLSNDNSLYMNAVIINFYDD